MLKRICIAVCMICVQGAAAHADVIQDHKDAPPLVLLPVFEGKTLAVAQTETTFDQWQACVDAAACRAIADDHHWGRGTRPLINVSWRDAQDYTKWLSQITGHPYRLLTDAEWTFAAAAGSAKAYWWGDVMQPGMARCRKCDPDKKDYGTLPAGSYAPNPFGLYDMHGNLWEWVGDCALWKKAADGAKTDICLSRLTRGGAWYYFKSQSKTKASAPRPEEETSFTVGFRVVSER